MMKKLLLVLLLTCTLFRISYAQYQSFLYGFSPESAYYAGLQGSSDSHYQLDTLYWDEWIEAGHSPGGAYWWELGHYRYNFSYLPNGKIHQIQQYVSSNGSTWGQAYRNTYEYDDFGRMASYTVDCKWSDGHWQWYNINEFTYDSLDRVIVNHLTSWSGAGYADSHNEYQYEYDDEGHLICKAYYMFDVNGQTDMYFNRWLYNYENGKLNNSCYQRYYTNTGWLNYDLYLYNYEDDEVSSVLHQKCTSDSLWYNYEYTVYEYTDNGATTCITTKTWNGEWVNKDRTTKTHNENGILIQELYQVWQNEEWVDKRFCDYTLDGFGNCVEGKWMDYVNGEWVDSESNYPLLVQFNNGKSILSENSANRYRATYSFIGVGINESSSFHIEEAFPNPGTDQFTIQTDAPISNVSVYDLMGRQVFNQATSETTIRINTESWPSGVYFWKTYNSSSSQCGKWIKN